MKKRRQRRFFVAESKFHKKGAVTMYGNSPFFFRLMTDFLEPLKEKIVLFVERFSRILS